jgi:hypothetical protein
MLNSFFSLIIIYYELLVIFVKILPSALCLFLLWLYDFLIYFILFVLIKYRIYMLGFLYTFIWCFNLLIVT